MNCHTSDVNAVRGKDHWPENSWVLVGGEGSDTSGLESYSAIYADTRTCTSPVP